MGSTLHFITELVCASEEHNVTPSIICVSPQRYLDIKREAYNVKRAHLNDEPLRIEPGIPDIETVWGIPIKVTGDVPLTGVDIKI